MNDLNEVYLPPSLKKMDVNKQGDLFSGEVLEKDLQVQLAQKVKMQKL